MRGKAEFSIRNNVRITAREGDKVIYQHEKHNIWLDQGRTWLSYLMPYGLAGYIGRQDLPGPFPVNYNDPEPIAFFESRRLFYAALGIGGNQQTGPIPAPVAAAYPGGNTYSDADVSVRGLERPVRVLTMQPAPPYWSRWVVPASAVIHPGSTPNEWMQLNFDFGINDINTATMPPGGPVYPVVPISEAALFHWELDISKGDSYSSVPPHAASFNNAMAYVTFPTVPKTGAMMITLEWLLEYA